MVQPAGGSSISAAGLKRDTCFYQPVQGARGLALKKYSTNYAGAPSTTSGNIAGTPTIVKQKTPEKISSQHKNRHLSDCEARSLFWWRATDCKREKKEDYIHTAEFFPLMCDADLFLDECKRIWPFHSGPLSHVEINRICIRFFSQDETEAIFAHALRAWHI